MTRRSVATRLVLATAILVAGQAFAQGGASAAPTPQDVVQQLCAAAGGLEAFDRLGILQIAVKREEVTQDGHTLDTKSGLFVKTPGPIPGRLEDPQHKVVAGDDGSGGWALIDGHADTRGGTPRMVKRLLTSDLFPLLLPFSLTWDGVAVTDVKPAVLNGKPVWRLSVVFSRSFFHTPQIATNWTIDVDRDDYQIRRADSPFTDLGKGVTADGMRFLWGEPVRVGGIWLRGLQRVIGLDELGREKSHSRIDHVEFKLLADTEASKLFANPIPPEMRPKYQPAPIPLPPGKS
ncbi:MAG: hypothetical protein ACM3O7_09040 [Acidobacteriota bacterium]